MIEHPRPIRISIFLSWLLLTPAIFGGENREQLLATARGGNRAAILSITSMECRYERKPWASTTPEQSNKYFGCLFSPGWFWRSGDVYRLLRPMCDGTTLEYVVRNGKALFLRKGGALTRPSLTFEALRPVDGIGGDMWQWLLFSHWGREPIGFYPLGEILEQPYEIRAAERLPSNQLHIDLKQSDRQLELWFDPKVNYLILKRVSIPHPSYRWEDEVIEFTEGAPAVFVPKVIEHRCFIKGTQQAVIRTILSDLKVNKPLDANALRIPGVAGTECVDTNCDVKYRVDADGNRVGPETSIPVAHLSPPAQEGGGGFLPQKNPFSSPFLRHPSQPSEPPTPTWIWILIVSFTVLVAALILAIIRRRRQAAQA